MNLEKILKKYSKSKNDMSSYENIVNAIFVIETKFLDHRNDPISLHITEMSSTREQLISIGDNGFIVENVIFKNDKNMNIFLEMLSCTLYNNRGYFNKVNNEIYFLFKEDEIDIGIKNTITFMYFALKYYKKASSIESNTANYENYSNEKIIINLQEIKKKVFNNQYENIV